MAAQGFPRKNQRWLMLLLGVLALTLTASAARANTSGRLFVIARSKNSNVVHYDVRLDRRGALNQSEPMSVYWVMHEEGKRRETLSWVEKRLAYGWQVGPPISEDGFVLRLLALDQRPLRVIKRDRTYRALITIVGKPAYLARLFVKTRETGLVPQVLYVELFGTEVQSGSPVYERINNK